MLLDYPSKDFTHVPNELASIYEDACGAVGVSPAASAALSRKAVQYLLQFLGYRQKTLSQQIDAAFPDLNKFPAMPPIHNFADIVRRVGNLAVHPTHLNSRLQAFEIEYEDAVWCLQIVELLFELSYELPLQFEQKATDLQCRLKRHSGEA